jgi:hypothetical protein
MSDIVKVDITKFKVWSLPRIKMKLRMTYPSDKEFWNASFQPRMAATNPWPLVIPSAYQLYPPSVLGGYLIFLDF